VKKEAPKKKQGVSLRTKTVKASFQKKIKKWLNTNIENSWLNLRLRGRMPRKKWIFQNENLCS
jgi:hypothetical protein